MSDPQNGRRLTGNLSAAATLVLMVIGMAGTAVSVYVTLNGEIIATREALGAWIRAFDSFKAETLAWQQREADYDREVRQKMESLRSELWTAIMNQNNRDRGGSH